MRWWSVFPVFALACAGIAAHSEGRQTGVEKNSQVLQDALVHSGASTQSVWGAGAVDKSTIPSTPATCVFSTRAIPVLVCAGLTRPRSLSTSKSTGHYWALRSKSDFLSDVRRWVHSLVAAVVEGRRVLTALAKAATKLHPSRQCIASSGAGFMMNDSALRQRAPPVAQGIAIITARKWKDVPKTRVKGLIGKHPLGGSFVHFGKATEAFKSTLVKAWPEVRQSLLAQLAATLVVSGFDDLAMLDQAEVADGKQYVQSPVLQSLLRRAIMLAADINAESEGLASKTRHFDDIAVPRCVPSI